MPSPKPAPLEAVEPTVRVVEECLQEGFPREHSGGGRKTCFGEASRRLGVTLGALHARLTRAKETHDLEPDWTLYRPPVKPAPFTFQDLPPDGEPDAETLIAHAVERHKERKAFHDAARLRQVKVHLDGPIGIAFFGDPHVDDPGCAWGDLERDVRLCRETEGLFAIDVGDDSNRWVGRLARLYAEQETTSKQALKLVEWLMTSLPWLLRIKGNHDIWHTDAGDPMDYIQRGMPGALEPHGARLQLNLPNGASCTIHVRHDFPGGSQFNPAHALVRETLFGYRDHVLACGHRHNAGYIPVWHNDPPRLCHGFRVGAYKDFDHYAKEKGFKEANWARSMGVLIRPELAADPVRFIRPYFSLEDLADDLKRARRST